MPPQMMSLMSCDRCGGADGSAEKTPGIPPSTNAVTSNTADRNVMSKLDRPGKPFDGKNTSQPGTSHMQAEDFELIT